MLRILHKFNAHKNDYKNFRMIPYLVKHLKFLQSRVLKVSGHVLERGNWSRSSRTRPLETTRMSLGHQPFLRLVLTCLKELDGDPKDKKDSSNKPDREEQKENLLQSLHTQLSTFLCFNKDEKLYNYEDPTARKAMQVNIIMMSYFSLLKFDKMILNTIFPHDLILGCAPASIQPRRWPFRHNLPKHGLHHGLVHVTRSGDNSQAIENSSHLVLLK